MMDLEEELVSYFVFDIQYSITPTFHQSIGPLFQLVFHLGKPPEFLCDKQVTKVLPIKIRKLQKLNPQVSGVSEVHQRTEIQTSLTSSHLSHIKRGKLRTCLCAPGTLPIPLICI
jgi:hypothetical protein